MPTKETLKCFECPEDLRARLVGELFNIFHRDITSVLTPYNKFLICSALFTEVYLVTDQLLQAVKALWRANRNPYSAGLYVGRLRKSKPHIIPSVMLANAVFSKLETYKNSVAISEEGLKPFLYGKDVLKASVVRTYPKIVPNNYVFVLGLDGQVYGLGISRVGEEEMGKLRDDEVVVRNVFDVGWYLRGGTEPRERKYKTRTNATHRPP